MIKGFYKLIKVELYKYSVLFIVNKTLKQIQTITNKYDFSDRDELMQFIEEGNDNPGSTILKKGETIIVRLNDFDYNSDSYGVVVHEIFHVTTAILNWAGIELVVQSDEAYAYLIEYLTKTFFNTIAIDYDMEINKNKLI